MGRGTGLGLSSVYGIVKGHGGYIDVASSPGNGATFSLFFPAAAAAADDGADAANRPAAPARGTATVLLVDDEKTVLEVGCKMLERLGYRVLTAQSGSEAVDLFRRHFVDLVVLDMIMPEMSGGRTFDRIRAIDPEARVLLSTGFSIEGEAAEIMARGCIGFLQKPFDLSTLAEKIQTGLKEKKRP
jgi:CheY-like chemotaxis protein